ncbi:MAG: hypothetical protein PHF10_00180 [Patescibacteria group bacterium]|nr:hypothetical protein [Patescibacteria group bacterium]
MAKRYLSGLEQFRPENSSFKTKKLDRAKSKKPSTFGFFFIFLILVIAASIGAFFYFNSHKTQNDNEDVKFWLDYSHEQIIGEENTLSVFVKNEEKNDLENVEVVLNFPDKFIFTSSAPECNQTLVHGCVWLFTKIGKDELKRIDLKGKLFGLANEEGVFEGKLNFRLSGFSADFQKKFSDSVILKPIISVQWETPETYNFSETLTSSLLVENVSNENIPSLQVNVDTGPDFIVNASRPESQKEENKIKWTIDNLGPNEKKLLEIDGYTKNSLLESLNFKMEAGDLNNGRFSPQFSEEKKILIQKFDLSVALEVASKQDSEQSVSWGGILPINLSYQNNSFKTIKDLVLQLKLTDASYIDFVGLKKSFWQYFGEDNISPLIQSKIWSSNAGSDSSDEYIISWDKKINPDFSEIAPGASGKISFNLPIKQLNAIINAGSQPKIEIQALANGQLSDASRLFEIEGLKINVKINTNLNLNAEARYYDDENAVIGQGPLPPQVGQETRYWIFWQLKNTINPVENISVRTKLPAGVSWIGQTKASHGSISYDESTREISWQIPQLDAYQGGSYSFVESSFEVSATPDSSSSGQILFLTDPITMEAKDQFTGNIIQDQKASLDSNLQDDPIGEGKGRVI